MTVLPTADHFVPSQDSFATARSDWLDAFADLEAEVRKCTARHQVGNNKKSLVQRLDDLAALKPGPLLSCSAQACLRSLVAQCRQSSHLRGTIVHSHMRVGLIDNVAVALFVNVAGEGRKGLSHVALTQEQLASSIENLRGLAAELRTFA